MHSAARSTTPDHPRAAACTSAQEPPVLQFALVRTQLEGEPPGIVWVEGERVHLASSEVSLRSLAAVDA